MFGFFFFFILSEFYTFLICFGCSQLIFNKGGKKYPGVKIIYSINGVGSVGQICANEVELDHLIPHTRINSKWIKDLNVWFETIKILEENRDKKILDMSCSSIFSDISPWAREIKEKRNTWDYLTLEMFWTAKETMNKMKRQPWPVWLSGLGVPQSRRSPIQSQVRARAWVKTSVPSQGAYKRQLMGVSLSHQCFSSFLSLSLPLSLK